MAVKITLVAILIALASTTAAPLSNDVQQSIGKIAAFFNAAGIECQNAYNQVANYFTNFRYEIEKFCLDSWNKIENAFSEAWSEIANAFSKACEEIKVAFSKVEKFFKTMQEALGYGGTEEHHVNKRDIKVGSFEFSYFPHDYFPRSIVNYYFDLSIITVLYLLCIFFIVFLKFLK